MKIKTIDGKLQNFGYKILINESFVQTQSFIAKFD